MKKQSQTIVLAAMQENPVLESILKHEDAALIELAEKNAKHFAKRNLPAPTGDKLSHYIGELKSGYEKLAAHISQQLQTSAHFPEARMDADFYKEKDGTLSKEIKALEDENHNEGYDLHNFSPGTIYSRIRWAIVATLIVIIGEILFNTKAFQVTGENMLFAMLLSISVSFAVFLFSHVAPLLYKAVKTKLQRRLVIAGSLFLVTGLFTALAIFRSKFLETHDVHINPFYFVIINLFFFIVSALFSFFILPSLEEIKENEHRLKKYREILKRNEQIKEKKNERENIREIIWDKTKGRVRVVHYANYSTEAIRKMYWNAVEIFKRTDLIFRTDRQTPSCFSDPLPELEIEDVMLLLNNRKAQ
jgi:hypothetical protein